VPSVVPIPAQYCGDTIVPASSSSSSEMSNIHSILSPSTERKVCEAQGRIEEEV
jgi:hypothetical protein